MREEVQGLRDGLVASEQGLVQKPQVGQGAGIGNRPWADLHERSEERVTC